MLREIIDLTNEELGSIRKEIAYNSEDLDLFCMWYQKFIEYGEDDYRDIIKGIKYIKEEDYDEYDRSFTNDFYCDGIEDVCDELIQAYLIWRLKEEY